MPANKHRQRPVKDAYFPMARCTKEERIKFEDLADKQGIKPTTLLYNIVRDWIDRRSTGGGV